MTLLTQFAFFKLPGRVQHLKAGGRWYVGDTEKTRIPKTVEGGEKFSGCVEEFL